MSIDEKLDEILATIGVEGIDDNQVVGRAGAKAAVKKLVVEARKDQIMLDCQAFSLDSGEDEELLLKIRDNLLKELSQ